ncbi:MAG TPA: hypothetical protein VFQ24_05405 [Terriglobia bacterium]|nr:hypothetical protein [Terriglobia bacterium]
MQAPPEPPRIEIPQQIKDLALTQVGATLHITFTLPTLATDGELLSKPVQLDVFRNISPAGAQSATPDLSGKPWISLTAKQLPAYVRGGKADYPFELSPQEVRQEVGSTFTFLVVGLTHGFRGRPRKSAPSNVAHATLLDATMPVSNLAVKPTQDALLLTWDTPAETLTDASPSHISGYRVYQSDTGKPGSFKLLGQAPASRFEDRSFQFGRQYYFSVSAVTSVAKETAESQPSAPVSITPRDIFPPPVPTGLTAVNTAGAVDLLWNASSGNDLAGYNVYRSAGSGPFQRISKDLAPTPVFHDASVAPGQVYEYAVTAVDLAGNESEKSKPASVTTPSAGAQ